MEQLPVYIWNWLYRQSGCFRTDRSHYIGSEAKRNDYPRNTVSRIIDFLTCRKQMVKLS